MSLYDEVLNCPDTHCRKKTLDKLCKEKIAEGMEKAAEIAYRHSRGWNGPAGTEANLITQRAIRQAAKDLEDS